MANFDQNLFNRGLAALRELDPALAEGLAAFNQTQAHLIAAADDPGDLNLDLGGTTLYPTGAHRFADQQVTAFVDQPERLSGQPPAPTPLAQSVNDAVDRWLTERGFDLAHLDTRALGANRGATLVSFGVGLGLHLPPLLDRLAARSLILLEPYAEFLWWSLGVVDWAALIATVTARGGTLQVLVGEDAGQMSQQLYWHLRGDGFGTIDGSYLYRHYANTTLERCHRELIEQRAGIVTSSKGFFEDELLMMTNATANLRRGGYGFVRHGPRLQPGMAAFIVGAGPSLDAAIPEIKARREDAVIFSAGSTLLSLMRNGIAPDFHCEIENAPEIYQYLATLPSAHPLTDLTLLASATVDPRVPPLFGRRLYYLRDSNMSAMLYAGDGDVVENTSPNCLNLALRMALMFGFAEIYLIGADFGKRVAANHHAADSIWLTNPDWAETYRRKVEEMTIELPANFGGKAVTHRTLKLAHMMAELVIGQYPEVRVWNCSDGLKIKNTLPKRLASAKLMSRPGQRAATVARIVGETKPDGIVVDHARLADIGRGFADWRVAITSSLDELQARGGDLVDLHDALRAWLIAPPASGPRDTVAALVEGSLMMIIHHAIHRALRLGLMDDRAVLTLLIEGCRRIIAEMDQRFTAALADANA